MRTIHKTARSIELALVHSKELSIVCILTCLLILPVQSLQAEVATYRLEVNDTWSTTTHPGQFPNAAHFSWLGGGTHNNLVSFWEVGQLASPGMVQMAEIGRTDILESEVNAAVATGTAWNSIAWHWWFCPGETTSPNCGATIVEFQVDSQFPLVTLASMLGPSPDWFIGVNGLSLWQNGNWVPSVTVDLHPFDGGTRSANVWLLGGPQNNPQEPISVITTQSGQLVGPASLGTMTFTLLSPTDVSEEQNHGAPSIFVLQQNFPNPFIGGTAFRFAIPVNTTIDLAIYDLRGRIVAQVEHGYRLAGSHNVLWDGRGDSGKRLSTGVYFFRLDTGQQTETRKLLLLQ